MFDYSNLGLRLKDTPLWLDAHRKVDFSFVSHGHADHIKKHRQILATPATTRFFNLRQGEADTIILDYGQTLPLDGLNISLYPAGHILGSAMIRVERDGHSLLYSGDFKLKPSLSCESIQIPHADILIMESTYGHPDYVFNHSRDTMAAELIDFINDCFGRGCTPVVLAYSLGKAQEAMKIVGDSGYNVLVQQSAWQMAQVYEDHGIHFNNCRPWDETAPAPQHVVVMAPHLIRTRMVRNLGRHKTVLLSGWGNGFNPMHNSADHVIALSDHADFDELFQFIDQVKPQRIYTTHGPQEYPRLLQERGYDAQWLS
jgi:putative mRNA 3-end processing factor